MCVCVSVCVNMCDECAGCSLRQCTHLVGEELGVDVTECGVQYNLRPELLVLALLAVRASDCVCVCVWGGVVVSQWE